MKHMKAGISDAKDGPQLRVQRLRGWTPGQRTALKRLVRDQLSAELVEDEDETYADRMDTMAAQLLDSTKHRA